MDSAKVLLGKGSGEGFSESGFRREGFLEGGLLRLNSQREPKGPHNEDEPKKGLRVSVCIFSLRATFAVVWPLATVAKNICVFPLELARLLKCLILMVASVLKNPTMIRVTLLCGRVLSERALWRLLNRKKGF